MWFWAEYLTNVWQKLTSEAIKINESGWKILDSTKANFAFGFLKIENLELIRSILRYCPAQKIKKGLRVSRSIEIQLRILFAKRMNLRYRYLFIL